VIQNPPGSSGGLVFSGQTDGFGGSGFSPNFLIPLAPNPAADLSQSFSSPGGTSSSQLAMVSSITNVAGNDSLLVSADPTTIQLDQTDLNTASPNDPATLQVFMTIPFTYSSPNPTETVCFDLNFDVSSNIPALTSTDSFTAESCIAPGSQLLALFILGGSLSSQCAVQGGTFAALASLGNGDALPVVDPVAAFSEVVDSGIPYMATFVINFQIKNDTGPTTLAIDNFTLSANAVPEPGMALLVAIGLLALGARSAPTRC